MVDNVYSLLGQATTSEYRRRREEEKKYRRDLERDRLKATLLGAVLNPVMGSITQGITQGIADKFGGRFEDFQLRESTYRDQKNKTKEAYAFLQDYGDKQEAKLKEASMFFFSKLIEPKVYNSLLDAIEEGMPLMDIAQVLMYQAYRDGLINPDLMMILVEQVVYMMAALAERQGIDFIIQEDDEEDIEEERQTALLTESMPNEITTQLDETELPPRQTSSLLGAN